MTKWGMFIDFASFATHEHFSVRAVGACGEVNDIDLTTAHRGLPIVLPCLSNRHVTAAAP